MHQEQRAPAKLTLGLRITGRRADGYHVIDAEMVTLDLADRLIFLPGDGLRVIGDVTVSTGEDNLVRRALKAVDRSAYVMLEKRIPVAAGLGGGSADAAAVLRWAGCQDLAVAAALGSDVPFCLVGGRARVSGTGDVVEPLPHEERTFTLLTAPFPVSTVAVYEAWDAMGGPHGEGPNDLEPAALRVDARLAEWRDKLGEAAGVRPTLAGSGGTWFVEGSFPDVPGAVVVRTEHALPPPP